MFDTYRLMTPAEAQEIVAASLELEWEVGKARTKEATGTIKKNLELKAETSPGAKALLERVKVAMSRHRNFLIDHTVKKMMFPKLNRYGGGAGEYQRHGDAAVMGGKVRTDLACTIFLTHPHLYKGGELCIEAADGGFHSVKGDPGTAIVYPCHMPHWVNPVTEGERISAVTWMESCYRDTEQRNIMRRFLRCLKDMELDEKLRYGALHTSLGTIHSKLQRMWIEYE